MRGSKKASMALVAVAFLALVVTTQAWADAPPGPYFNGFESNTAGWFNDGGTITRVASGDTSTTYANGVTPSTGNYYARLGLDPAHTTCPSGGGPQPWYSGPYTKWGGYSSIFPPGGYSTGADIYLDVSYAQHHLDTRFDWASAINMPDGMHRRDFVFNVGTDALGFVITGGNNSTRCGADPYSADPTHAPMVHITQSGWYTFKHQFVGIPGGTLSVILTISLAGSNVPIATWTRTDASDVIGSTVGGNRYGWFVQNEFDGLAIDNTFRTGVQSTPGCTAKISNGGTVTAANGDKATFGGNAKVSSSGSPSGQETYQDHGPATTIDFKATSVAAVICASSTEATIFGSATVNGAGTHEYEIDLKDAGEPGTSDTYRIFIPDIAYDSGTQTLEGGNIQIAIS
jgi:hypothetical protein